MKLAKSLSLYTFVSFLNKGLAILVLPILTRYLTPADYGVISLMNTYVQILIPIIGLSSASLVTIEYHSKNLDSNEFRILFSSVRAIPLLISVPLLLILALGAGFFPEVLELPLEAYWLLVPLTLFVLYNDNFLSFMIATKRAKLFSIVNIAKVVTELSLTVLFVVGLGMAWQGRIYSWLIIVSIFGGISVVFYRKWGVFRMEFSRKYILQAITFGAPLILHQIGKFVINQSDRLFITKLVSRDEMGVYSVGYQVGMVMLLITTAFGNAFTPILYECLKENTIKKKLQALKVSYVFVVVMLIVFLLVWIFNPLIFKWLIGEKFAGGSKYVPWICLSYFFWSIYLVFSGYIFYFKKSKLLGYLAFFNVAMNVTANYFFILKFGTIGAAYATCISFFIMAVAIVTFAVRIMRPYEMPWLKFRMIFGKQ